MHTPQTSSSIQDYWRATAKFPLLSPEEEFSLAQSWRQHGDQNASHKMAESHLRLAAKIAFGYKNYGFPVEELIEEANVGLMQAIKRFDPDRGFRLATYAIWWIRAAV